MQFWAWSFVSIITLLAWSCTTSLNHKVMIWWGFFRQIAPAAMPAHIGADSLKKRHHIVTLWFSEVVKDHANYLKIGATWLVTFETKLIEWNRWRWLGLFMQWFSWAIWFLEASNFVNNFFLNTVENMMTSKAKNWHFWKYLYQNWKT